MADPRVPQYEQVRRAITMEALARTDTELTAIAHGKLRGLCPFHGSKPMHWDLEITTPNNRFRCVVCGVKGDALDYVQRRFNLTRPMAVQRLAEVAGVTWEIDDPRQDLHQEFAGVSVETVGDRIRAAITIGAGLNITDFAEKHGIARPLLSRWINDPESSPAEHSLEKIAAATGVVAPWLRYGTGDPYGYEPTRFSPRERARLYGELAAAYEGHTADLPPAADGEDEVTIALAAGPPRRIQNATEICRELMRNGSSTLEILDTLGEFLAPDEMLHIRRGAFEQLGVAIRLLDLIEDQALADHIRLQPVREVASESDSRGEQAKSTSEAAAENVAPPPRRRRSTRKGQADA